MPRKDSHSLGKRIRIELIMSKNKKQKGQKKDQTRDDATQKSETRAPKEPVEENTSEIRRNSSEGHKRRDSWGRDGRKSRDSSNDGKPTFSGSQDRESGNSPVLEKGKQWGSPVSERRNQWGNSPVAERRNKNERSSEGFKASSGRETYSEGAAWNKKRSYDGEGGKPSRRSEPVRSGQNRGDWREQSKSSFSKNDRNWESSNSRRNNRFPRTPQDDEFREFQSEFRNHKGRIEYIKIKEQQGNLFDMSEEYSLAHCVAEDMNMGSGIAVRFRYQFKCVEELLNQHQRTGGLAVLKHEERYIYYLVTKKFSTGKPTYATLFSSLKCLREHMKTYGVNKLAIPRIGCGLDRLEWDNVKFMVEFIFRDEDVEIVVCSLEPIEESPQQRHRNSKLTNVTYPIQDIEQGTIILYFSSEDEFISEEMKNLAEKYPFMNEFRAARKISGKPIIYTKNPSYMICGCIVKKSKTDLFDFNAFKSCLNAIQRENKQRHLYYYAFQAFKDEDTAINYKIINIMRNSLRDIEVYVCWPGDLQEEMSDRDRFNNQDSSDFRPSGYKKDESWRSNSSQNASFQNDGSLRSNENQANRSFPSSCNEANQSFTSSSNETNIDWFQSPPEPRVNDNFQSSRSGNTSMQSWSDEVEGEEKAMLPHTPASNDPIESWEENNSANTSNQSIENEVEDTEDMVDHEFETFLLDFKSGNIDCSVLTEEKPKPKKNPNLPEVYSRVCFATEDLSIESGIAPGQDFDGSILKLLKEGHKEGGLAYLKENNNFLYFLIIGKPTTTPTPRSIFSSIQKLRDHITKHAIKNLVVPDLKDLSKECEWDQVKKMLAFLLGRTKVAVTIVHFTNTYTQSLSKKKCVKISHRGGRSFQMRPNSIIMYLASCDGDFNEEHLDKKFSFGDDIKRARKPLGEVVRYATQEYIVYGCFVKNSRYDSVNLDAFSKCVSVINRNRAIDKLFNIGIQVENTVDESINHKMVTLFLYGFEKFNIVVFWGDLKNQSKRK